MVTSSTGKNQPSLDKNELEPFRQKLAARFGKTPSESDVAWAYLNQQVIENSKHGQWGLYRNTRLSMAAVLEREGKQEQALRFYLEVCYLDLNGPQNRGELVTKGRREVMPGPNFRVSDAFLAPAVVTKVMELALALQLEEASLRKDFAQVAERQNQSLKLPLPPDRGWKKLSAELYK